MLTKIQPKAPAFGNQQPQWKVDGFPSPKEHAAAKRWIQKNNLNKFGDPKGSIYAGGSPIWTSGKKLYQYLLENHPAKPWNTP